MNDKEKEAMVVEAEEEGVEKVEEKTEPKGMIIKDKAAKLGRGVLKVLMGGLSILGGVTAWVMIKDGISGRKTHEYLDDLDDIVVPEYVEDGTDV